MTESKDHVDYEVNSELEAIADKLVPLNFRKTLFGKEPYSKATRLSVIVKYISINHPQKSISPKIAAYMIGIVPPHPRGIHPMVQSIKKQEENFPEEVITFNQRNKKYDSSRSDSLLNSLTQGTIHSEDINS